MAHKHAELMKMYAEDAAETDNPWERLVDNAVHAYNKEQ